VTPDAGDTISGETSQTLYPGDTMRILVDKTNSNFIFI